MNEESTTIKVLFNAIKGYENIQEIIAVSKDLKT